MQHAADGSVLDVGRKTRTIPPAIRRALATRDPRCGFPGCDARRCDAHHVRHWAEGGETRLDNLVLLCRRHHRAVHEGGFTVTRHADGAVTFLRPDGRRLEDAPRPPRWIPSPSSASAPIDGPERACTLDPSRRRLTAAGIEIGPHTVSPWDGTPFDVVWAIDVLYRSNAKDSR